MARRLKERPLTDGEKAIQWFNALGAKHKYFQTSFLANLSVLALLSRIARRSQKEAQWLRRKVRLLVAAERNINPTSQEVEEFEKDPAKVLETSLAATSSRVALNDMCKSLLLSIAADKVPREDHDKFTISDQRKWLTDYLKRNPSNHSASPRQYKTWIMQHSKEIYPGVSSFDCLCEYRDSFDGITEHDLQKCRGPANLIEILLATLHWSTPAAIRKVLSHSTKK